jgi:glycerate-2-kinase
MSFLAKFLVKPIALMQRFVSIDGTKLKIKGRIIDIRGYRKIWFIGFGKASCNMINSFSVVSKIEPDFSLAVVPEYQKEGIEGIMVRSTHPIPSKQSAEAATHVLRFLKRVGSNDIVFFFVSGGSSSLIELPSKPFTMAEFSNITGRLILGGANIEELNTVRITLSSIKGGRLLKNLDCKLVVSFILSDVVPDKLRFVASGITYPTEKDIEGSRRIMERYSIDSMLVKKLGDLVDDYPFNFPETYNIETGSNKDAVRAAKDKLSSLGFSCNTGRMGGHARELGYRLAEVASNLKRREAYIFGGETTVRVTGKGLGGRNQEIVLSALKKLESVEGSYLVSFSTDGKDGPTDAAGAFCSQKTAFYARKHSLDPDVYLENNDSYNFFKKINRLIVTGETGTNVADVAIVFRR